MSTKPIFVATHPRACSTAFERVFMTRHESMTCVHEPFGDAFYYGPERLSERFAGEEQKRIDSGFNNSTYKTIFDRIDRESNEGKRLFIKDMMYYLMPIDGRPASIAPSLQRIKRGVGTQNGQVNGTDSSKSPLPYDTTPEPNNPIVVPSELLDKFHFAFLIRDPHSSIPSYWRCTVPPLDELTGWDSFLPNEAGYDELRRGFDYLREIGQVGPHGATGATTNGSMNETTNGVVNGDTPKRVEICMIDADDLLDNPSGIIEAFCKSVGVPYEPEMLIWDTEKDQEIADAHFEKWPGFHEDAKDSKELRPRTHHKKSKTEEEWDDEWRSKYGEEAAKVIRKTVDANMEDYYYLKRFAVKV